MGMYIMTDSGDKYYMDAVFDIAYTQAGRPSEYALQSGVKVSDHYSQDLDSITISGSVSKVKFVGKGSPKTDLDVFEKELTALKKSGETFNLLFSDNLGVYPYCVFTNLTMTKNLTTGNYALDIQMTIQQVTYAQAAGVVSTPVAAAEYADMVEEKKASAGNTKEGSEKETARLQEIQNSLAENSLITGLAVQ